MNLSKSSEVRTCSTADSSLWGGMALSGLGSGSGNVLLADRRGAPQRIPLSRMADILGAGGTLFRARTTHPARCCAHHADIFGVDSFLFAGRLEFTEGGLA